MSTTAAQLPGLRLPTPPVSAADVRRVLGALAGRGWTTARQLADELGIDDRELRLIAEHSGGRIVSAPGSPGYKLASEATDEEIDRAASAHESQGRRHLRRAAAIRIQARRLQANGAPRSATPGL